MKVGLCICKHKAGEGLGAKTHKTECNGLVSGAPCETAVEGNGGRWWWGSAFTNTRQERGLRAKSDDTDHDGSVSGVQYKIAVEGDGGR